MNEVILSVKKISVEFDTARGKVSALSDVSFDVYPGEVFALVGESGSGKTTAGRTIMGIYPPTRGEVFFRGERIRASAEESKIALRNREAVGRVELSRFRKDARIFPERLGEIRLERENAKKSLQNDIKLLREEVRRTLLLSKGRAYPGIQMIFQDPHASLNPRMTVGEIVGEGLLISGVKDKGEIDARVDEALMSVGLSPYHKSRRPHEFSGGQKQRIGIARAVIMNPEVIIADEPVSALDASVGAQVINLLWGLAKKRGIAIVFIAHDLSVVRHISDRVGVMYKSRLIEVASTAELFKNPREEYTRSLLAAAPVPDPARYKRW